MSKVIQQDRSAIMSGLASRLRGTIHQPDDPAYQACCTIWNAMIEKRPLVVVRPLDEADVATVLSLRPGE